MSLAACERELKPLVSDWGEDAEWSLAACEREFTAAQAAKARDANQALIADIREECARRGLPTPPSIELLDTRGVSGKGLTGDVRIEFAVAVTGPIFLGRSRHLGGGGFAGDRSGV